MTARRRRRLAIASSMLIVLAAGLALLVTTPASAAGSGLPPTDTAALSRAFRKQLEPLGLEVQRGLLQSLETYEEDPAGTHLALYVEPSGPAYTSADYVRNFSKLVNRFVPMVFERWKGLESFDICQEPLGDTRAAPPPVTQVFVKRDALSRVANWRKANLTELIAAAPRVRSNPDYYVYFAPTLRDDPALVAAEQKAGATTPTSSSHF